MATSCLLPLTTTELTSVDVLAITCTGKSILSIVCSTDACAVLATACTEAISAPMVVALTVAGTFSLTNQLVASPFTFRSCLVTATGLISFLPARLYFEKSFA